MPLETEHALSLLRWRDVKEQLTAYSFSGLEFQLCGEKRIIEFGLKQPLLSSPRLVKKITGK